MKINNVPVLYALLIGFFLTSCNSEIQLNKLTENNTTSAYKEFLSKSEINVPIYPLTKGPKHYWFGYYDKFQTDPTDRYVLSMRVDFEHRSPIESDQIKIGLVDLKRGGQWIELGTSKAWNWQQGCMLQWSPGSQHEVVWNDRINGKFVSHIFNVKTKEKRTIPFPIYTLSPDGKYGLSLDFERVQDVRAGYGYAGIKDKNSQSLAPEDAGIYKVSLKDGSKKLIVSMQTITEIPFPLEDLSPFKHYFNHLDINTDGTRFVFLNRWVQAGEAARVAPLGTRFITADMEGDNIHMINDSRMTSHFWWKNPTQLLAWANRPEEGNHFYLFEDTEEKSYKMVGMESMKADGHCSYLINKDWILNDTYPNKNRRSTLYLYNTLTNEKIVLGKFYMDKKYKGEWRVDLHPRLTRDGTKIIIDCPVGSSGRQLLLLDISHISL